MQKGSKMSIYVTPAVVSKVSPQLGSYICSFLVIYTSETSTPKPPGDNFDPLMALPASFLLPGFQPKNRDNKFGLVFVMGAETWGDPCHACHAMYGCHRLARLTRRRRCFAARRHGRGRGRRQRSKRATGAVSEGGREIVEGGVSIEFVASTIDIS